MFITWYLIITMFNRSVLLTIHVCTCKSKTKTKAKALILWLWKNPELHNLYFFQNGKFQNQLFEFVTVPDA